MGGPSWGRTDDRAVVEVALRPERVEIILWLVVGSLISLNLLVGIVDGLHLLPYTLTRFFDGNDIDSLLTGARTTLLLLAILLLAGCTLAARRGRDDSAPGWRVLALVGAFAFLDEITRLHRSLSEVLHEQYGLSGVQRYTWAVLYLPAAVAVGRAAARPLRRMSPGIRGRLVSGVVLYAIGTIGLEPLTAVLADRHGVGSLSFRLVGEVAESAQLTGLTLVCCAALVAASRLGRGFTVVLAPPGGE